MEEQRPSESDDRHEIVYRTKAVQFLGRSTPIILQNDNGPCPLLAICNVLLLRNSLSLGVESSEVSLQKLLSLIAEKLIDSNSNIQDKDDEYVINQQQNIADAIDLLPRLATGIDVNVQFRKINDFEFTRECAIFDLFDIGLYHGWIVDPQDIETARAIGSKSYNTLVAELVAFEPSNSASNDKNFTEEDSVDFAAATTAALGVPSPCLSRGRSFDDQISGKGDREEAEELMRALNLSKVEISNPVNVSLSSADNSTPILEGSSESKTIHTSLTMPMKVDTELDSMDDRLSSNTITSTENDALLTNTSVQSKMDQLLSEDSSSDVVISSGSVRNVGSDQLMPSRDDQPVSEICAEDRFVSQIPHTDIPAENSMNCDSAVLTAPAVPNSDVHLENGTKELQDASEVGSSSLDDSEPMYEGEECILDPGLPKYEEREPIYEGEVVLAQQADKMEDDARAQSGDQVVLQQCRLIKNFLENSASQLTIYGLFCLQEGLKERELCVFFRNNHFSTMFKFNGELYLLATDQGYINQPDLVWEKLNEVNGDTVFMTGNFTEFKIDNQVSESWNEQNVMTSTADYLATLEASKRENSSFNSDLQLAIALQQQEFEQQQPQQQSQRLQQQSSQQAPVSGRPRLVTGPQVSRTSHTSQRTEPKKEKCTIM